MIRLVVVSGLSGSGKSVALNMLEDLGWYCIDNIPAGSCRRWSRIRCAPRNRSTAGWPSDSTRAIVPTISPRFRRSSPISAARDCAAKCSTSMRRTRCCCGDTRRPADAIRWRALASSLADAIAEERRLLHPLIDSADLVHRHLAHERPRAPRPDREARRAAGARTACRSCSSPSASSTERPATPISCSTRAPCRIRTGNRRCSR